MRLQFFAFASLLSFVACESEVTPVDGDGGSGGIGGSSSQGGSPNVTTGGAGDGGTPTTTNGGGGSGGSPPMNGCEQTCANVEACFGITCDQVGLDCGMPQAQCVGECTKDATCEELADAAQGNPLPPEMQACVDACGLTTPCQQCLNDNDCLAACMGNDLCMGWGQCAFNCDTPDCYADCNAQFPEAEPAYSQIYECACTNCQGCQETVDPCNQGSGTGGGGGGIGTGGSGGAGGI